MSKALAAILTCLLAGTCAMSQVVLERQAISCFSLDVCNQACISSTAGQVEFITTPYAANVLTQGFQQPGGPLELSFQMQLYIDRCNDTYEAVISNISGCADPDSTSIYWNDVLATTDQAGLPSLSTLVLTAGDGCSYTALYDFSAMEVTDLPCDLTFYTYLSPNGDGDNDEWIIRNIGNLYYAENKLTFFNRWGGMVWEGSNYNNTDIVWKGKNKAGEDLPDGTYYYVLEANGREYKGYVELMR